MGTTSAQFDVRAPRLDCNKEVCADLNLSGGCDTEYAAIQRLSDDTVFPVAIEYRLEAVNSGETALTNVVTCDDQLLFDLGSLGMVPQSCQLSSPSGCSVGLTLGPGASITRSCRVVFDSREDWEAFAALDLDANGDCYANSMYARGTPALNTGCTSGATQITSIPCDARVCVDPPLFGACCTLDGQCRVVTELECGELQGTYNGDNTPCRGDLNHNGINDACEEQIPTVSQWGLVVLALLLLTAGKLRFRRAGVVSG